MSASFVIRRSLQIIAVLAVAAALALAVLLYGRPPRWAMQSVAASEASWLLNSRAGGRRFLVGQWFDKGLSQSIAASAIDPGLGDVERIGRALVAIKPLLISQPEVAHGPTNALTGAAGLGWCNHVNLFAGDVLATSFDRVELVAVSDVENGGSHSIGRAWSDQTGAWLYFDVWPDEIVVFRATPSGARVLFRSTPIKTGSFTPAIMAGTRRIYDTASGSFTLYRANATFGSYLFETFSNVRKHGSARAVGADQAMQSEARLIGRTSHQPPPMMTAAASREYLLGRIAQAEGQADVARRHYAAAARLEPVAGPYRSAATILAARLGARRPAS